MRLKPWLVAIVAVAGVLLAVRVLILRATEEPVAAARSARSTDPGRPDPDRSAPQGAYASSAASPKHLEICGFGLLTILDDFFTSAEELHRRTEAAVARGLAPVLAQLQASTNPVDRALQHFLEATAADSAAVAAASARMDPDCEKHAECRERLRALGRDAAAPYLRQLVQVAEQTRDPGAMVLARRSCQWLGADFAPCRDLTPARLAEHDPDNAYAWLLAAGDASGRKDAAGQAQAMSRAATASTFNTYWGLPMRPLALSSSGSRSEQERTAMLFHFVGLAAASSMEGLGSLSQWCTEDALRDAGRHQQCDQLTRLLVAQGDTMLGLSLGVGLAKRLAWPRERIEALENEKAALNQLQTEESMPKDFKDFGSCAWMARLEQIQRDVSVQGELPAWRQRLAQSDRSVEQLARAWRERAGQAARPAPK